MAQPNGSFEEVYSISGNPLALSCGCTENVRLLLTLTMRRLLIISRFYSRLGKKCCLVRPSSPLFTLMKLTLLFQLLDHTRDHCLARCREGLDGLFLFRLQGR